MHGLEDDYWGRVDFIYLDVDNSNNRSILRRRFGDRNVIPRFYVLDANGTIVHQWTGGKSSRDLREVLDWTVTHYGNALTADPGQMARQFVVESWRLYHIIRK